MSRAAANDHKWDQIQPRLQEVRDSERFPGSNIPGGIMDYEKLPLRQPQAEGPRWENRGIVDLHSPMLEGGLIEHGCEGISPRLQVKDSRTEVLLRMHCPGVPRESLEVGVEDGKLYLAGEGFRRCLSLPDDIDTARIEAFYGEGILEIHLRKA